MIWTARKPDAKPASLPAAMPPVRLEFVYDSMSRRCVKRLYDKSGEGAAAVGGSAVVEGSAAAVVQSDEEPVAPESGGVVIPVGWTLTSTFKFVWDGWNLLAELDGEDGVLRTCAWGLDLSGSEQGAGGVGGLVFQYLSKPDTTYRLYYDGNGNVTSLRDDGSTLSCDYVYGPFGETLTARGDDAALAYNTFKFSTKYADAESGLLYYGYRYYNPGTGRWLNRDPIDEEAGPSLYAIVYNAPTGSIDPLGLERIVIAFDGFGATSGISTPFVKNNWEPLATAINGVDFHYYSWYSSFRPAYDLMDKITNPIDAGGCEYHTLVIIGFSNGGNSADNLAEFLRQKNVKVDYVVTVDPIPQTVRGLTNGLLGYRYSKRPNVTTWRNYYQNTDSYRTLRGNAVKGAETDKQFVEADFAKSNFTTYPARVSGRTTAEIAAAAHHAGNITVIESVLDAIREIGMVPEKRADWRWRP